MAQSPEGFNSSNDMEYEPIARSFRDLVELGVAPEMRQREQGFYSIYHEPNLTAKSVIYIGSTAIEFMYFDPQSVGMEGGLQGLDFSPSHGIQIVATNPFFERVTGQTMFGLRHDDRIVRALLPHGLTGFSMYSSSRELDREESGAIVDYIAAPHLRQDALEIAMRLTDEEKDGLEAAHQSEVAAASELQQRLNEIDESRRRGWEEAMSNHTRY